MYIKEAQGVTFLEILNILGGESDPNLVNHLCRLLKPRLGWLHCCICCHLSAQQQAIFPLAYTEKTHPIYCTVWRLPESGEKMLRILRRRRGLLKLLAEASVISPSFFIYRNLARVLFCFFRVRVNKLGLDTFSQMALLMLLLFKLYLQKVKKNYYRSFAILAPFVLFFNFIH